MPRLWCRRDGLGGERGLCCRRIAEHRREQFREPRLDARAEIRLVDRDDDGAGRRRLVGRLALAASGDACAAAAAAASVASTAMVSCSAAAMDSCSADDAAAAAAGSTQTASLGIELVLRRSRT